MNLIECVGHIETKLRSTAAALLPARAFVALYSLTRTPYLRALGRCAQYRDSGVADEGDNPPSHLFKNKLAFRNDLGNAAGFDKDGSLLEFNYRLGAGFAVVGTVLSEPHTGNQTRVGFWKVNPWTPLPRSESAINSLGLPSKGIDSTVKTIRRFKERVNPKDFPIGVSIMGHPNHSSEEEKLAGIETCVRKALGVADFIEINESCPNTAHDAGQDAMATRIRRVIELRDNENHYVPVLVKLADLGDVDYTVRFLASLGVDGVVIVNTQKNYTELASAISQSDRRIFDYYTKNFQGGVSGKAIRDFSFSQARSAAHVVSAQKLDFVVVHVGGISSPEDMRESRAINDELESEVVALREWYTGLMDAMGTKSWKSVYSDMIQP
jgi:dihydroorotate dehydrogenase